MCINNNGDNGVITESIGGGSMASGIPTPLFGGRGLPKTPAQKKPVEPKAAEEEHARIRLRRHGGASRYSRRSEADVRRKNESVDVVDVKAYNEAVAMAQNAFDEAVAPAVKAYREAIAPARKAYNEATAQAWKAYDEAVAPELKAYHEATAPARKAYAKAKAYDEAIAPAQKAYDEAVAPAQKAYDEAVATARKEYEEAVATARKAFDDAVAPAVKAYREATAPAHKAFAKAVATASKAYDEAVVPARKAYNEAKVQPGGLLKVKVDGKERWIEWLPASDYYGHASPGIVVLVNGHIELHDSVAEAMKFVDAISNGALKARRTRTESLKMLSNAILGQTDEIL